MQTRSDKMRPKILGLRIVKYFVENLKEEYLVLLAETIPFLGELLEDVEISVKSLAQDILQEMESLSGESLRQYLWCRLGGQLPRVLWYVYSKDEYEYDHDR